MMPKFLVFKTLYHLFLIIEVLFALEWSYGGCLYERKRWTARWSFPHGGGSQFVEPHLDNEIFHRLPFWSCTDFAVSLVLEL